MIMKCQMAESFKYYQYLTHDILDDQQQGTL